MELPPPTQDLPPTEKLAEDKPEREERGDSCSVLIRNLSSTIVESDLEAKFGPIGKIKDIHMPRHHKTHKRKGFAFVEFTLQADADESVAKLNNTVMDGRTIRLEIAKQKRKTPSQMLGRSSRDRGSRRGRSPPPRRRARSRERRRSPDDRRRRRSSVESDSRRRPRRRSRDDDDDRRSSRSRSPPPRARSKSRN